MRLSQVLAQDVADRTRSRGLRYFESGAVKSLSIEQGVVHATVRGSDTYDVWIEPLDARLRAQCSCPFFLDHLEICKHIWAVVLAADAQSVPLVAPGAALNDVYLFPAEPDEPDEFGDGSFHEGDDDTDPWRVERYVRPTTHATAPSPWQQLLHGVRTIPAPPGPGAALFAPGQLLYVVDADQTQASGALVLELMTRDRKANGDWGKPRPISLSATQARTHPDPLEREILERLLGAQPYFTWAGVDAYGTQLARLVLKGVVALDVLPKMCATGRCMLRTTGDAARDQRSLKHAPLSALEWDHGPPWNVRLSIRASERSDGYTIDGWLARGDERKAPDDALILLADGVLVTATHAARLQPRDAVPWLAGLRRHGRIDVPAGARDELIDALLSSSPELVQVPDELRIDTVATEPRPYLRLRAGRFRPDRLRAELGFEYEGQVVLHDAPGRVVRAPGSTRAVRRDGDAEQRALGALFARGFRDEWDQDSGGRALQIQTTLFLRHVRLLLDEGWHVEVSGRAYRQPGAASFEVRSGIDWFELHGQVAYGNQRAQLPALLAALHRGETFVPLEDGTVGLLPEDWLRRYGRLAQLGAAAGEHLRFRRSQVALLDALLAAQPDISWDEASANARAELKSFEGIHPADPPVAFAGTLRGYQREGLGWLRFLQRFGFGGCLADDMGLGKTVMVLALLAARHEPAIGQPRGAAPPESAGAAPATPPPSLVVAPRSVVFNWRQEAARFAPGLKVLEYVGGARSTLRESLNEYDLVLTTYGTLRRDASALSGVAFDYVILDEAQAIKNASSVSAKATRVLKGRHRLALTGTPIENRLADLWSLFEFLNPGLLGSAAAFGRADSRQMDDEALGLMSKGLRPFLLRRTKEQVAADLPPKTEQTLYCELEKPQRALYDQLRMHYRQILLDGAQPNGFGRAKLQVLEALLRLRQAACHPGLIDHRRAPEPSAKLDVLVPRLVESVEEGHKTLVFSQFTSLLAILKDRLDKAAVSYEYLDGRTRDRQSKVERFQTDPSCRLFLISLKAGGLGLNLTAAEYVFLLDPWWNPAVEAQALDRAHRIGQERHVFGYRLIARDTVEERVLELQQRKRKLADAILTTDNSLIRDLKREDLELLLS